MISQNNQILYFPTCNVEYVITYYYRITSNTTLIGRGQSVDVFLDSTIRKGLISRAHAQIIQKVHGENGECVHEIFDTSLNGTYVNDIRVKGSVILKEGDTVAFGHLRGSLIEPGALAPQKETEFLFKVSVNNLNFTLDKWLLLPCLALPWKGWRIPSKVVTYFFKSIF